MVRNLPANAGDSGSVPGSGRSPGEGNGKSLQYSCLGNPMDRGAWQATVLEVATSRTRLILNSNSRSHPRGLRPHDLTAAEAPPPASITPGVRVPHVSPGGRSQCSARGDQPYAAAVGAGESRGPCRDMTPVLRLEEPLSDPTSFRRTSPVTAGQP